MSDFYRRLVEQTLGVSPLVYPVALSPQELANSFADQDAEHQRFWDEVSTLQQPESRERAGPEGQLDIDEGAADDAAAPVVQPGDAPARKQPGRRLESAEDSGGRSQPPQIAETQSRAELRSESRTKPSPTQISDPISEPSRAALHTEVEQDSNSTSSSSEQTRTNASSITNSPSPRANTSQASKTAIPSTQKGSPVAPAPTSQQTDDTPVMTPSDLEAVEQETPNHRSSKQTPALDHKKRHEEISTNATTDLVAAKPNAEQMEPQSQAQDFATHEAETTQITDETPNQQNLGQQLESHRNHITEARNSFQKRKDIAKQNVTPSAKSTSPSQIQETHATDSASTQNQGQVQGQDTHTSQVQDTHNQIQESAKSSTPSPFQDIHNSVRDQVQDPLSTDTASTKKSQVQDTLNQIQESAKSSTPSPFQDIHNSVQDQAQDTLSTDTASTKNTVRNQVQDSQTSQVQGTHNQIKELAKSSTPSPFQDIHNPVRDQAQDTLSTDTASTKNTVRNQVQDSQTNQAQDTHSQVQKVPQSAKSATPSQFQDAHTKAHARDIHKAQDTHTADTVSPQPVQDTRQVQDTHTNQVQDTHTASLSHQIHDRTNTQTQDLRQVKDIHSTDTASPKTQAIEAPTQDPQTPSTQKSAQSSDHAAAQTTETPNQAQDIQAANTTSSPAPDIHHPSSHRVRKPRQSPGRQAIKAFLDQEQAREQAQQTKQQTDPPIQRRRQTAQTADTQTSSVAESPERAAVESISRPESDPIDGTVDNHFSDPTPTSTTGSHETKTRQTSFDAPPTTVSEPTDFLDTANPLDDGRSSRRTRTRPQQALQSPTQTEKQSPAPQQSLEQKPKATTQQQSKSINESTKSTKKSASSTAQQASTRPTHSSEQHPTLRQPSGDQKLGAPSRTPHETQHQTSERQDQTSSPTAIKPSNATPETNRDDTQSSLETQPATPRTETRRKPRASKPTATTPQSLSKVESAQNIDRQIAQTPAESIRPIPSEQPLAKTSRLAPNADSPIGSTAPDSQVTRRRTSPVESASKPANLASEDGARQSERKTNIAQAQKIGPTAEAQNTAKRHNTQAKNSKKSSRTEQKSSERGQHQRLRKSSPQTTTPSRSLEPVDSSKNNSVPTIPTTIPKASEDRTIAKPRQTAEQTKAALQPSSPEQLAAQPNQAKADTQSSKIITSPTQERTQLKATSEPDQNLKSPQAPPETLDRDKSRQQPNRHKTPSDPEQANLSRSRPIPRSPRQAPTSPLQQKSASSIRSAHPAQKPETQKAATNLAPQSHEAATPPASHKARQTRDEQPERSSNAAKMAPAAAKKSIQTAKRTHQPIASKPESAQAKQSAAPSKSTIAPSPKFAEPTAVSPRTQSKPVQSKTRAINESIPETKPRSNEASNRFESNPASQEPAASNTEADTRQATPTQSLKTERLKPKADTSEAKPTSYSAPNQSATKQPFDSSRFESSAVSQEPTISNTRAERPTAQKRTRPQDPDRIDPKASAPEISEAKAKLKQPDSSRFKPKAVLPESRKITPVQSKTSDEPSMGRTPRPAKPTPILHESAPTAKTQTSQTANVSKPSAATEAPSQKKLTKTTDSPQVDKAHPQKARLEPNPESPASVLIPSPSPKTRPTVEPLRSPQIFPEPPPSTSVQTNTATKPHQVVDTPQRPLDSPRFEPKAISHPEPILQSKTKPDRQTTAAPPRSLDTKVSPKSLQTSTSSATPAQQKAARPEAIKHPSKPTADAQPPSQKRAEPAKSERPAKATEPSDQSPESITPVLQKESTVFSSAAPTTLEKSPTQTPSKAADTSPELEKRRTSKYVSSHDVDARHTTAVISSAEAKKNAPSQRAKATAKASQVVNELESATPPTRSTTSQRLATIRNTEKPTTTQSRSSKERLADHPESPPSKASKIASVSRQAPSISRLEKAPTHTALNDEVPDRSDQATPRTGHSNHATSVPKRTETTETTQTQTQTKSQAVQTQQATEAVVKPSKGRRSTHTEPKYDNQTTHTTHMSAESAPKTAQKPEAAKTRSSALGHATPLNQAPSDRAISPQANQALQTGDFPNTEARRTSSEAVDPQTTATPVQTKSISPVEPAPTGERSQITKPRIQNRSALATKKTGTSSTTHQTQVVSRKTTDAPVNQAGHERFADHASITPNRSMPMPYDAREVRAPRPNPLHQSAKKTEPGLVERPVEKDRTDTALGPKPRASRLHETRVEHTSAKHHQTSKAQKTATPSAKQPPRAAKATVSQTPVKDTAIHTKSSQPKPRPTTSSAGPQMTHPLAEQGKPAKTSPSTTRRQTTTKPQMTQTLEERHVDIPAKKPSKARVTTPSPQQITDTTKPHSETSAKPRPTAQAKSPQSTTPTTASTTSNIINASTKSRLETPAKTTGPTTPTSAPSTTPQLKNAVERRLKAEAETPPTPLMKIPTSSDRSDTLEERHVEIPAKSRPTTRTKTSQPTTRTTAPTTNPSTKTQIEPPAKAAQQTPRTSTPATTSQTKDTEAHRRITKAKTLKTTAHTTASTPSSMSESLEERHVEIPAKTQNSKAKSPTRRKKTAPIRTQADPLAALVDQDSKQTSPRVTATLKAKDKAVQRPITGDTATDNSLIDTHITDAPKTGAPTAAETPAAAKTADIRRQPTAINVPSESPKSPSPTEQAQDEPTLREEHIMIDRDPKPASTAQQGHPVFGPMIERISRRRAKPVQSTPWVDWGDVLKPAPKAPVDMPAIQRHLDPRAPQLVDGPFGPNTSLPITPIEPPPTITPSQELNAQPAIKPTPTPETVAEIVEEPTVPITAPQERQTLHQNIPSTDAAELGDPNILLDPENPPPPPAPQTRVRDLSAFSPFDTYGETDVGLHERTVEVEADTAPVDVQHKPFTDPHENTANVPLTLDDLQRANAHDAPLASRDIQVTTRPKTVKKEPLKVNVGRVEVRSRKPPTPPVREPQIVQPSRTLAEFLGNAP